MKQDMKREGREGGRDGGICMGNHGDLAIFGRVVLGAARPKPSPIPKDGGIYVESCSESQYLLARIPF